MDNEGSYESMTYEAALQRAARDADSRWGIEDFSEQATSRGVAYCGRLTDRGAVVAEFENRGDGGATLFRFIATTARRAFLAEARRLFPGACKPDADLLIALLESR